MIHSEERERMEFVHEGIVITVTPEGVFAVQSEKLDKFTGEYVLEKYPSLKMAKEEIDNKIATARKAQNSKVNVTLLDEAGRTMTLRRVHEGTGNWLTGKGEMDEPRSAYLNMDVPKDLLAQRQTLREQVQAIDESLRPYSFTLPKGFGKQTPEKVDSLIEQLRNRIAQAQEKVDALSKPVEA